VPEAINGGPIALVKDGDKIVIDSANREINWLVDEDEQARRKKEWEASGKSAIREKRGVLYRYARDVAVSACILVRCRWPCDRLCFFCLLFRFAACKRRCVHRLNGGVPGIFGEDKQECIYAIMEQRIHEKQTV
jgi:hypothetical protein